MATADVDVRPADPAPAVPDYLASPNAVFEDKEAQWRYGHPQTTPRLVLFGSRTMNHEAGSLPQLVENLVKNWEVEASFKPRLEDWRTIDHANYTFAINGGPPQTAEHMLKVGTYNAIVAPNEYYSPEHSDFATSHKTFKRMMPTFAWEVLEVYSGPPRVAFRWRHWGEMRSDYVGFNNKGEKITAKAHGGKIDIEGVTVAEVDDKVRLRKVETWFDPMEMFRQIAPQGIVNKEIVDSKIAQDHNSPTASHADDAAPDTAVPKEISPSTGRPADQFVPHQGTSTLEQGTALPLVIKEGKILQDKVDRQTDTDASEIIPEHQPKEQTEQIPGSDAQYSTPISSDNRAASDSSDKTWGKVEHPEEKSKTSIDNVVPAETSVADAGHDTSIAERMQADSVPGDMQGSIESDDMPAHSTGAKDALVASMETAVQPDAGEAVAVSAQSQETRMTYEEMSKITPMECPFLMNRE
ncbi:hypothetical protein AMS68_006673 [Peltaster fructicola]|uniref:SnoaL-like domain-containing protein n=1 Tax=Peltaster fructicola TaxID=286661 RepID=A0A6H0Y2J3_9PEZI|nr:hypothetical protein AMS68_006673 [Peltaster fructicola]